MRLAKIVSLLVLVALLCAQTKAQTQQDTTRRAKSARAVSSNQAFYAADPGWRAVTNQMALIQKDVATYRAQQKPLQEMAHAKRKAKQSSAQESAKIDALEKKIELLTKKLAELTVKKLEAEQRVDAFRAAQKKH